MLPFDLVIMVIVESVQIPGFNCDKRIKAEKAEV